MSDCHCEKKCVCVPLCSHISGFQFHPTPPSSTELDTNYYAHHFDVGTTDEFYQLPPGLSEGQVMVLRLRDSMGGVLRIDVTHLAGNLTQIQMNLSDSFAVLHYKCCQWFMADGVNATCT